MGSVLLSRQERIVSSLRRNKNKSKKNRVSERKRHSKEGLDEKENDTSRKSNSATPVSDVSSVVTPERRSPRKVRRLWKDGAFVLTGQDTKKRQRKSENPQRLDVLRKELITYTPYTEEIKFFDEPGNIVGPPHRFLCRNVRKQLKIQEREQQNPSSPRKMIFDKTKRSFSYELQNKLRINSYLNQHQVPLYLMEFERVSDWSEPYDGKIVNDIIANATIHWQMVVVKSDNKIFVSEKDFAIVPMFKKFEENLSQEQLAKMGSLKLRSFTCSPDVLEDMMDAYLIVEVTKLVEMKMTDTSTLRKRQRPGNAGEEKKIELSENIEDYVQVSRFGCKRVIISKRAVESVSDISLVENGHDNVNFSTEHWKSNLNVLNKLDAGNKGNSFEPHLIFSPIDSRVDHDELFQLQPLPKWSDHKLELAPRSHRGNNERRLALVYQRNDMGCMQNIAPNFKTANDQIIYLKARFPNWDPVLTSSNPHLKVGETAFQFTPTHEDEFPQPQPNPIYNDFVVLGKRYLKSEEMELEEKKVNIETLDVGTSSEQIVQLKANADGNRPHQIIKYYPRSSLQLPKKERNNRKAGPAKKKSKTDQAEEDEQQTVPGMKTWHVPIDNARLLNEIQVQKRLEEVRLSDHDAAKESERVTKLGEMVIVNDEMTEEEAIEYRKRQAEASELVAKNKFNKKKRGRHSKQCGSEPSTSWEYPPVEELTKIDGCALNGGTILDLERQPIPVGGHIVFPLVKEQQYNICFRTHMSLTGYKLGSHSAQERSDLLLSFIESYHKEIFENGLDEIWLKHLQLMSLDADDDWTPAMYTVPEDRFYELKKIFMGKAVAENVTNGTRKSPRKSVSKK